MSEMNSNSIRAARIDLAAAHRMAVLDGLNEGTWNHFSLMVPGRSDRMLISPEYCHWKMVTASNLDLLDEQGKTVGGKQRFDPAGYCIHYAIHIARPDATCVLHAHSPYATAIGMIEDGRLEMAEQNALGLFNGVAYYDYDGVVTSLDHGRRLAEAMGTCKVLFLRGHGVLVTGGSAAEAYTDLYQLERACAVQCLAMATGRQVRSIPEDIARGVAGDPQYVSAYKSAHFAAMKRLLDIEQPDYVN